MDIARLDSESGDIASEASRLIDRTVRNNSWRQRECFNLIPSENTPSPIVKLLQVCDPCGRYAEHRLLKGTDVYFYQGTDFIGDVERKLAEQLRKYLGCTQVELRPISGQMANEVVYKAVLAARNRGRQQGGDLERIRSVLNNALVKGGHLSYQHMGAMFNYVQCSDDGRPNITHFPVRREMPYKTDEQRLRDILLDSKPELIIFGKSLFLHREPVRLVRDLVADWKPRPLLMYDMAHVFGLYGAFQDPLAEGADLVTGTTHKTFFGPQRGVIASRTDENADLWPLWLDIQNRAFPGSTSNHHLGTLLGLLFATYEMNVYKEEYQTQVQRNAKAWAKALKEVGLEVEGDPTEGYTETHQVVIRVSQYGTGLGVARRLEDSNIICNFQALPDDSDFLTASGLRTGVSEMTRFGMNEADFGPLAELFAECVIQKRDVSAEASHYRQQFQTMRFCLPAQGAAEMGARLVASTFPASAYAEALADAMYSLAQNSGGDA